LPVVDTTEQEWTTLFHVNCLGFVRAYSALKELARNGKAAVVVLSSDTTRVHRPGNGAYTASKAALEAVVRTLAREEASYGVRINAIAPSLIASPLAERILRAKGVEDIEAYAASQPWGRLLSLDEVADVAVSVALGDGWDYATGQVLRLAAEV
jgi:NAD(P)-dependent dehydrogenase (short-subunit alcohol dehydrogenase family)